MTLGKYTQKYEDETRGRYFARRAFSAVNIIFTLATFALLVSISFITIKKSDVMKNSENFKGTNLKEMLHKTDGIPDPSSFPTFTPAFIPKEEEYEYYDDLDDINKIKRRSKYPTHHPKRDVATTAMPTSIYSSRSSMFPIAFTATFTSQPIIETTEMVSESPTFIVVTDDFHVTPIVVINTEDKKDQEPVEPLKEQKQKQDQEPVEPLKEEKPVKEVKPLKEDN